jgi:ABC-type transporter MlaC component
MVSQCTRSGLLLVLVVALLVPAPPVGAYFSDPGYVPLRRDLPNGIDMLESGLYWLQDLSGVENPRDPASIIGLMEDQAARFFDFAYMAYLVGGPEYTRLNALQRSHFQNRLRDKLFEGLARRMGMFNSRIPQVWPITPHPTGPYTWVAGGTFYHPAGPDIRLVFYFYLSSNGWRIYDVTSNGVSAVENLRETHFAERFKN